MKRKQKIKAELWDKMQYLFRNYYEDFHFSENYLIRIFREATGTTPHAYVGAARIRKAKLLLSTGDITADRVAYECGFADYAHFYRMFRRSTGTSPRAYRQRMVNGSEGAEAPEIP